MQNGDLLQGGALDTSPDSLDFTYQAWLMRVNAKGCFDDDCSHVDKWWYFPEQFPVGTKDLKNYSQALALYPNPFQNYTIPTITKDTPFPLFFQISTIQGQTVTQGIIENAGDQIETDHLVTGTYIILCKDKAGKIYFQKGVKI